MDIRSFLLTPPYLLFTEMLSYIRDTDAVVHVKRDHLDTLYRIEQVIHGTEAAKIGNSIIKTRVGQFLAYAYEYLEEQSNTNYLKPNLEKK